MIDISLRLDAFNLRIHEIAINPKTPPEAVAAIITWLSRAKAILSNRCSRRRIVWYVSRLANVQLGRMSHIDSV